MAEPEIEDLFEIFGLDEIGDEIRRIKMIIRKAVKKAAETGMRQILKFGNEKKGEEKLLIDSAGNIYNETGDVVIDYRFLINNSA